MYMTIVNKVRELATKYPNAIYKPEILGQCSYFEGTVQDGPDTCGCIFGQAIREINDPVLNGVLIQSEEPTWIALIVGILNSYAMETGTECTRAIKNWCATVQRCQDKGMSWGSAVAEAEAEYPLD